MDTARSILLNLNALVNSPITGKSTTQKVKNLCVNHMSFKAQELGTLLTVEIPLYDGDNPNIIGLMQALGKEPIKGISSVILQGSLATGEETAYSDLDALVVLSDEVFSDKHFFLDTVTRLQSLSRFIAKQDPLQHHGWFVTSEKLLKHHYDDFFPVEIFRYSRCLFPNRETFIMKMNVKYDQEAYMDQLRSIVRSIQDEVQSGQYLQNLYNLKSLLSKFMLLPALYEQTKSGVGVYKKHSFDLAKADFSPEDWRVMDEVSHLRTIWKQDIPAWNKWLINIHPSFSRKVAKRIAPKVNPELRDAVASKSSKMMNFARLLLEQAESLNAKN